MARTTADYVQMLKDEFGLKSNYQVAQFLEMNQQSVANWVKGRATLDDSTAIIIATKLQIDPALIITECHLERAEKQGNELVASTYKKILKQLQKAATTGAAACLTFTLLSGIFPY